MVSEIDSFVNQLRSLGCDANAPAWPDAFGKRILQFCNAADSDNSRIRVLSLFSGAGGLDIGFRDAGFDIVESVELEERFCQSLEANSGKDGYFPDTKVNCIDIREYEPGCGDVDFIIGGPPCQTFSAAGRRANGVLGTSDPRGILFKEYVRVLTKLNPKGFLFENVYGIVGAEGGKPWQAILDSFEEIGYKLFYRVLDAADYGAPQHRERLFIIGLREGEYRFPRPLFGVDSIGRLDFYNAQTAIKDANKAGTEIPGHINGRYGYLIDDIPPGLNYSFYTEKMGHPKPVFAWRSKFSDFMYKADPEMPVRTIKAQGGQYTGPYHWSGRHFSLPEYKRLQTFPDDYKVCGGRGTVIHQLGNSVPPQLARILALTIREQVFGRPTPVIFDYLNEGDKLSFRSEKAKLTRYYRTKAAESINSMKGNDSYELKNSSYDVSLTEDFEFSKEPIDEAAHYHVKSKVKDGEVVFVVEASENSNGEAVVGYSVSIKPKQKWSLPYKCIRGEAHGDTRDVLTALWKTIEHAIAQTGGAADLVQLNGYYQYKPNLDIELKGEPSSPIDNAIYATASGSCTRKLMSQNELAALWEVPEDEVLECARELRTLGYEVRNNKTNPQIPLGAWLVPYEFPTLTPMSIQLRKQV